MITLMSGAEASKEGLLKIYLPRDRVAWLDVRTIPSRVQGFIEEGSGGTIVHFDYTLASFLHELTHLLFPFLSEKLVDAATEDIFLFLVKNKELIGTVFETFLEKKI